MERFFVTIMISINWSSCTRQRHLLLIRSINRTMKEIQFIELKNKKRNKLGQWRQIWDMKSLDNEVLNEAWYLKLNCLARAMKTQLSCNKLEQWHHNWSPINLENWDTISLDNGESQYNFISITCEIHAVSRQDY